MPGSLLALRDLVGRFGSATIDFFPAVRSPPYLERFSILKASLATLEVDLDFAPPGALAGELVLGTLGMWGE